MSFNVCARAVRAGAYSAASECASGVRLHEISLHKEASTALETNALRKLKIGGLISGVSGVIPPQCLVDSRRDAYGRRPPPRL